MTTTDLHNQLLQYNLTNGVQQLRSDFEFNDLFEPVPCEYCSRLTEYYGFITWNYCPQCGRKLKKGIECNET